MRDAARNGLTIVGLFLACLLLPGCTSDKGENGKDDKKNDVKDPQMASELAVGKATPDHPCHDFEVEVMESSPVQFAINLKRDLPSPGHKVEIGEIALQADKKTIVAQTTTTVPEGAGLTVIDTQDLRFALGSLPQGSYVFELRDREKTKGGKPGDAKTLLKLELTAK